MTDKDRHSETNKLDFSGTDRKTDLLPDKNRHQKTDSLKVEWSETNRQTYCQKGTDIKRQTA